MQAVRIALVQLAWTGSRESMAAQYRDLVAQAASGGARIVCLPEFSLLPYFPGTQDRAGLDWVEPLHGGISDQTFGTLAKQHGVSIIASIYERGDDGKNYDTATIHAASGELAAYTRKVHIPSGEGYYETDFFRGGIDYPVHEVSGVKVAAPTCYDQWFPEMARISAMNGAEFIFYPTAIGAEPTRPDYDSREAWITVQRGHAVANGVYVAAANRVGTENGITFYGSSFVCDPTGKIISQARLDETTVIFADLDPELFNTARQLFPLLHQRKPGTYARLGQRYDLTPPPQWLTDAINSPYRQDSDDDAGQ